MQKNKATDAQILGDLEYRGCDSLLCEIELGLRVPACFAERVARIIGTAYDMRLTISEPIGAEHSGHFCLMPYTSASVELTKRSG